MKEAGRYRKIYNHLVNFNDFIEIDTNPPAERDLLLKILLIGDSGIGKVHTTAEWINSIIISKHTFSQQTSLLQRFVNGDFSTNHYATIGVDFMIKNVKTKDSVPRQRHIKLQIWVRRKLQLAYRASRL